MLECPLQMLKTVGKHVVSVNEYSAFPLGLFASLQHIGYLALEASPWTGSLCHASYVAQKHELNGKGG